MKRRMLTMLAVALALTLAPRVFAADEMVVEDRTLTTGADSNATASFYVEQGVLDSIGVDVVSTLATGTVTVVIAAPVSTETAETMVSLTANAADINYLMPCRWYTTAAGALHGGTNAPSPYRFNRSTVTATITGTSTVATGKVWRVILRYLRPVANG